MNCSYPPEMVGPAGDSAELVRLGPGLVHRLVAAAFAVLVLLTGGVVLITRAVVADQDQRLLDQRANEVSLVFTTSISSTEATLQALGHVARDGGTALFTEEATRAVTAGPGALTFALLRPSRSGFVVVAAAGRGLFVGETATSAVVPALRAARARSTLVTTPVIGSGAHRYLGFALGGAAVPSGTVLYRQSDLGRLKAPREAGTAPFHELSVVLYDASRAVPSQVLVTTTAELPLIGAVRYLPFPVGSSHWLLAVSSPEPLVGTVAAWAPWIALVVGLAASALIAATFEQVFRRRDAAVALYRSEHRVAETLQHRLLPTLAAVPGLDIASRYVAGSDSQQVGGDWFDVFEISAGRTAVVIGDVMGHDIEAAAAMAQVRAALRAYALEDDGPAAVVERLAHLVDVFDVTGLVTVVYGLLGPPTGEGARPFDWANAGHLSPLVWPLQGGAYELDDGRSPVIGAPDAGPRAQGHALLAAGSSLVLYTDGLVERPGTGLSASIEQLRLAVERLPPGASASHLCEQVLGAQPISQARDDIAIVVVRLLPGVVGSRLPPRSGDPAEAVGATKGDRRGPKGSSVRSARRPWHPLGRSRLAHDGHMAYDAAPSLAVAYRHRVGEGTDDNQAPARLVRVSAAANAAGTVVGRQVVGAARVVGGDNFDRDPGPALGHEQLDVVAAVVDHPVGHQLGDHH